MVLGGPIFNIQALQHEQIVCITSNLKTDNHRWTKHVEKTTPKLYRRELQPYKPSTIVDNSKLLIELRHVEGILEN